MAFFRRLLNRLAASATAGTADRDLAREIDAHLALLEEKFVRDGMTADEARLAARRAFGGVEQAKEHQRDARAFRWVDDARKDSAYAVRSLLRSPSFTIAAVLTLAIGIGATTAIYSVVDRVLLQPLPFHDADRLVRLVENQRPLGMQVTTYPEYLDWRARTTLLSGLAAVTFNPQATMRTRDGTFRLAGGLVSPNYFEVIGVPAMLGRTIVSADEANREVVVLTFETWQQYFHANPAAVGSTIEVRMGNVNRLLTVVGVLPEGQEQLATTLDFYAPIVFTPNSRLGMALLIGRLGDGVSLAAASEEADRIGNALRPPRPANAVPLTGPRMQLDYLKDGIVAELRPALRVFLTAVAVLLMIVCANVANLLLARGSARQREIAVRLALGASRGRIVRQVLTECLILSFVGGALGAAVGAGGVALVKNLATVETEGVFRLVFGRTLLPRANEVTVDLAVLATALTLAAATSVIFGLLPALHLSRTSHLQAMGSRGSGSARRDTRLRTALAVGQLVMATVLLVGAGLLGHSFLNLSQVEKGYDAAKALAFQLVMPADYATARKAETIEAILTKLRAAPGVEAVGFAYAGILLGVEDTVGTWVPPGRTLEELQQDTAKPRLKSVSHGYLEAMGVRLLNGRGLDGRDSATAPLAVVVNRSVVNRYFGNVEPVGAVMTWHSGRGPAVQAEVVGVVDDVRQGAVARAPYSEIFMDYRQLLDQQVKLGASKAMAEQLAFGFYSFGLRTTGDPVAAIPFVRQTVRSLDGAVGIDAIVPMERLVANSVSRQRFYAVMLSVFAAVAGLLALIGIYGVLAYAVIQRTQEIGIRMALGARQDQVLALVLRRGLVLAAIGISIGLAGAAGASRYLQGMLFGIEPLDVATFAGVGLAFALVAALASYLPARRATQVDPIVALRVD